MLTVIWKFACAVVLSEFCTNGFTLTARSVGRESQNDSGLRAKTGYSVGWAVQIGGMLVIMFCINTSRAHNSENYLWWWVMRVISWIHSLAAVYNTLLWKTESVQFHFTENQSKLSILMLLLFKSHISQKWRITSVDRSLKECVTVQSNF